MKIAILYDVIYPFSIGGGEKNNWELARRLVTLGHDVSLVTSQMWEGEPTIDISRVHCIGVCRWLGAHNNLGNRSILQPLLFALGTYGYLRKQQFDVVVCCAFPYVAAIAAKAAIRFRRTPLAIIWFEARGMRAWTTQAGLFLGYCATVLERLTGRLSPFNTAISRFTADRMEKLLTIPPANIAVIHCGVDVKQVASRERASNEPVILTVGRLVRHKRIDMLISAFSIIADEFTDHCLYIIGEGAEKQRLLKMASSSGFEDRIRFIDALETDELYDAFATAKVFVLPSEQEGFGIVVIEAMAASTPVLVHRAPLSAAASIIDDGRNGLLFDDVVQLADQLRRVLSDRDLRAFLVSNGRETATKNDWDKAIVPAFEAWLRALTRK